MFIRCRSEDKLTENAVGDTTVSYCCKYCKIRTKYGFVLLKHVKDEHGKVLSREELEDAIHDTDDEQ